jgi:hypothetical protein
LLLIDRLSFSPIAGAEDANASVSPGEAHRHDAAADLAKAEVALLCRAMVEILGNDTARIGERRYEAKAGAYRTKALKAPTAFEVARQLLEGAAELHGEKGNPVGCLGVHGALACGDESDMIRQELSSHRIAGEKAIRQRLVRAKAQGDLPADANPSDLARYLSVVLYGMAVQSVGGASRGELRRVAAIALSQWPDGT